MAFLSFDRRPLKLGDLKRLKGWPDISTGAETTRTEIIITVLTYSGSSVYF